jgi:AcrR family transcriptional regulator
MRNASTSPVRTTCIDIAMVAERLYAQVGFGKTTVSDIARELRMSPANVYRYFPAKAAIDEAVARRQLAAVENAGEAIVAQLEPAAERLGALLAWIETSNENRFLANRKLHELLETAFSENWPVAREHIDRVTKLLSEIIAQGNRDGEFAVNDPQLSAILIRSACIRFWHPRLLVEGARDPEPTLDQMVDFCLAAMAQRHSVANLGAGAGGQSAMPNRRVAAAS